MGTPRGTRCAIWVFDDTPFLTGPGPTKTLHVWKLRGCPRGMKSLPLGRNKGQTSFHSPGPLNMGEFSFSTLDTRCPQCSLICRVPARGVCNVRYIDPKTNWCTSEKSSKKWVSQHVCLVFWFSDTCMTNLGPDLPILNGIDCRCTHTENRSSF